MKFVVGIVAVIAILVYTFFGEIRFALLKMAIQPDQSFAQSVAPPAPDYSNPAHWAALPERSDLADVLPQGSFEDVQSASGIDVFFIHPTTYLTSDSWNQPLDNQKVNDFTDETTIQGQASAFNGCCKVYAPRYRQATIFSFMDENGDGDQALDLAYQDVKSAFKNFIETRNNGRPFILAAHSQGSKHADRLLEEVVVGSDLQSRLIAAYPIGFDIDESNGLPVCTSPSQTGCQVSWNTVGPEPATILASSTSICVNPLSWQANNEQMDSSANAGGVDFGTQGAGKVEAHAANAVCAENGLTVTEINSAAFSSRPMGFDNLHVYDYALFYLNIRQNAKLRVATFLSSYQP